MPILTIDKFVGGLHSPYVTSNVQMDASDCEDALNVEFYPRGTVSRREGYGVDVLSNSLSSNTVASGSGFIRLYKWKSGASDYQLGYTCTSGTTSATIGTIDIQNHTYTILTSGSTSHAWDPEYDDAIDVTSYANSAIATYKDTAGPAFSFNGTVCSAQTTMESGAACIEGFGNYLFIANHLVEGIRKGSRLSWNSAGDISSWPSTYYIDLDPDDGDEITALKLMGEYLVVFKKYKIFIVYWVGGSLLFKEARRTVTVGCVGPNAVVEHQGKLIFISHDGVYSFDGTSTAELSKKIRPLFRDLNPSYLGMSEAFEVIDKKQIWFCVPYNANATSTSTKNYVFVWDYELDNWTKFSLSCSSISMFVDAATTTYADLGGTYSSEARSFASYATVGDDKVYLGFLGGTIHQYGEGATSDNGTAIPSVWKGAWLDVGDPLINKRLVRSTFLLGRRPAGNLLIDINKNWVDNNVADTTLSWTGTQSAALTGSTTAELLEKRIDATHQARAFQIVLSGDSSGYPWSLHKIMLDIVPKGRTLVS